MVNSTEYAFASGGLLWKIIDRSRMERKTIRLKILMLIGIALLCWIPLAVLNFIQFDLQQFFSLFVRDVATHVRFFWVLPLMFLARNAVNKSFNNMITRLYDSKIVDSENTAEFEKVIQWVMKMRNSLLVDILLILGIYAALYFRETSSVNEASFYAPWVLKDRSISYAGWWYILFSLPIIQMIIFRWFYTILLWIIFLWKISKINLHLSSLHPDGMGGLGFFKYTQLSFFPVAFAFSSIAAAGLNNMMIFSNVSVYDFQVMIVSVLVFVLLIFILPLMVFLPLLANVKKKGYMEYSRQAWLVARQYEK